MAAGRHFEKKENLSHYFSLLRHVHQIWHAGGHGQPATSTYVTFGLQQNPRWRPSANMKNGKSQKLDHYLRFSHKFFNKTANIIYKKNCKQFI